eukprot:IDg17368t1
MLSGNASNAGDIVTDDILHKTIAKCKSLDTELYPISASGWDIQGFSSAFPLDSLQLQRTAGIALNPDLVHLPGFHAYHLPVVVTERPEQAGRAGNFG